MKHNVFNYLLHQLSHGSLRVQLVGSVLQQLICLLKSSEHDKEPLRDRENGTRRPTSIPTRGRMFLHESAYAEGGGHGQ